MSNLPLKGSALDLTSSSAASSSNADPNLEKYYEAKQRLDAAAPLPSAASLPNFVRGIHNFVQLAAARHKHKEMSETRSDVDSDVDHDNEEIQQSLQLHNLEEHIFKTGVHLQDFRVELVAAEAQEAAQCAEWQDLYFGEAADARSQRVEAEVWAERLEERLQTAALASMEHLQVDCWRVEAAECEVQWAAERSRLTELAGELQDRLAACHRDDACRGQAAADAAARAAASAVVERNTFEESKANIQSEIRLATLQAQASQASCAVAEETERQAHLLVDSLNSEQQVTLTAGNEVLAELYMETYEEANALARDLSEMREIQRGHSGNANVAQRIKELEKERTEGQEAADQLHAESRSVTEELANLARMHSTVTGASSAEPGSTAAAVQDVQAHLAAQARAVAEAEEAAAAETAVESAVAVAASQACAQLRIELKEEVCMQQELHSELQALSSAAASVRAAVAAKDESIANIVSTTREMATEMVAEQSRENRVKAEAKMMQASVDSPIDQPAAKTNSGQVFRQSSLQGMLPTGIVLKPDATATYEQDQRSLQGMPQGLSVALQPAAQAKSGQDQRSPQGTPPGSAIGNSRQDTRLPHCTPPSTEGSVPSKPPPSQEADHYMTRPSKPQGFQLPAEGLDVTLRASSLSTLTTENVSNLGRARQRSADTSTTTRTPLSATDPVLVAKRLLSGGVLPHSKANVPPAVERAVERGTSNDMAAEFSFIGSGKSPASISPACGSDQQILHGLADLVGESVDGSLEPGTTSWEKAQSIVTESLRNDINSLRSMFLSLGVTSPATTTDGASDKAASDTAPPSLKTLSLSMQPRVKLTPRGEAVDAQARKALGSQPLGRSLSPPKASRFSGVASVRRVASSQMSGEEDSRAISLSESCRAVLGGKQPRTTGRSPSPVHDMRAPPRELAQSAEPVCRPTRAGLGSSAEMRSGSTRCKGPPQSRQAAAHDMEAIQAAQLSMRARMGASAIVPPDAGSMFPKVSPDGQRLPFRVVSPLPPYPQAAADEMEVSQGIIRYVSAGPGGRSPGRASPEVGQGAVGTSKVLARAAREVPAEPLLPTHGKCATVVIEQSSPSQNQRRPLQSPPVQQNPQIQPRQPVGRESFKSRSPVDPGRVAVAQGFPGPRPLGPNGLPSRAPGQAIGSAPQLRQPQLSSTPGPM